MADLSKLITDATKTMNNVEKQKFEEIIVKSLPQVIIKAAEQATNKEMSQNVTKDVKINAQEKSGN